MAKKSKKSGKSSKRNLLVALVLFVFAVVVACMVFTTGANYKVTAGSSESVSPVEGLKFTFGNADDNLKFNTVAFLGFFLPVIGSLLYLVAILVAGNKAKVLVLLPTLCFVAGAVLCFLSVKGFTSVNGDAAFSIFGVTGKYLLGVGPIVGGSVSVVGALLGFYGTYVALAK